jgi:uncharacterized protein (DUF1778 family)
MDTTLTKRLDLRVAQEEKDMIDQAAALTGSSTSDFVRRTLLAAARETIQAHTAVRLTMDGSRAFVAALKNPPAPNENLRALVREFSAEVGP